LPCFVFISYRERFMGLFDWFQRKSPTQAKSGKTLSAESAVVPQEILPFPNVATSDSPQVCVSVRLNEGSLFATLLTGHELKLDFVDFNQVAVRTTDEGDWAPDVFWIISAGQYTCMIPQGIAGEADLFNHLIRLPGFDKEMMISAISSTENSEFECWKRESDSSIHNVKSN
jgi:hypothetical protein